MDENTPASPDVYVGSSKVTPVTLPSGLISVQLPGFSPEQTIELKMTADQWESVQSPTPYEDGDISARKWKVTIAKVLTILTQDNMEMNDKDFVIQRIDGTILQNYRKATAKLFGVDDQEHVTMQNIIDILNPKTQTETKTETQSAT